MMAIYCSQCGECFKDKEAYIEHALVKCREGDHKHDLWYGMDGECDE